MKRTERGFWQHEMKDSDGQKFCVQDSSLATDNCVWIYMIDGRPQHMIHLNRARARRLIKYLNNFVETGSIKP